MTKASWALPYWARYTEAVQLRDSVSPWLCSAARILKKTPRLTGPASGQAAKQGARAGRLKKGSAKQLTSVWVKPSPSSLKMTKCVLFAVLIFALASLASSFPEPYPYKPRTTTTTTTAPYKQYQKRDAKPEPYPYKPTTTTLQKIQKKRLPVSAIKANHHGSCYFPSSLKWYAAVKIPRSAMPPPLSLCIDPLRGEG